MKTTFFSSVLTYLCHDYYYLICFIDQAIDMLSFILKDNSFYVSLLYILQFVIYFFVSKFVASDSISLYLYVSTRL